MSRSWRRLSCSCFLIGCLLGAGACTSPKYHEPQVSDHLEGRTGHSVGIQNQPGVVALPSGISLNEPLTDEAAVAIALWNNAAFQELLSELGLAEANFIQAGQIANPTFMALFPIGPKQLEFSAKFPLETLWMRDLKISIATAEAQQVAERIIQGGLDLVRDVKLACADLGLASATADSKRTLANTIHKVSTVADSRLQAGDLSELEAAASRFDALNARQEFQRAEVEIAIKYAQLKSLLGLGNNNADFTLAEFQVPQSIERGLDELLVDALATRPEARLAELEMEAAGRRADIAQKEIYQLTAILDANGSGGDFEMGPGLELPIPLFDQNKGGKALAAAQLEQAARSYITVRDSIVREVRQAHALWNQARRAVEAWDGELIPQLNESFQLARKGVDSGDLEPLALLVVEQQMAEARLNRQTAVTDAYRARVLLERAIGHRLDLVPSGTRNLSKSNP